MELQVYQSHNTSYDAFEICAIIIIILNAISAIAIMVWFAIHLIKRKLNEYADADCKMSEMKTKLNELSNENNLLLERIIAIESKNNIRDEILENFNASIKLSNAGVIDSKNMMYALMRQLNDTDRVVKQLQDDNITNKKNIKAAYDACEIFPKLVCALECEFQNNLKQYEDNTDTILKSIIDALSKIDQNTNHSPNEKQMQTQHLNPREKLLTKEGKKFNKLDNKLANKEYYEKQKNASNAI
jgi:hypothetical protein